MATYGSAGARKGSRQVTRKVRIALSVLVALMLVVPTSTQSAHADATGISSSGGLTVTVGSVPLAVDVDYWPPVTIWWTRAAVEDAWGVMGVTDNVCSLLPLPFFVSVACRNPASQADAIASAHYQHMRIKQVYHGCRLAMFCNYSDFFVLP